MVLRQPHAVAAVAQEMAELVFDVAKSSTISADLTAIARTLRTHAVPTGSAKTRLVRGDDRAKLMRLARETAVRSIMVGGDRLGLAAEARTIIPMMAAAKRSVEGTICYSKQSGPVSRRDAQDLQWEVSVVGRRSSDRDEPELVLRGHARGRAARGDRPLYA